MKKAEKKLATVRTQYGLFQCVFEPEPDMGGYTAVAPKVRGAVSWGSTLAEAKRMIVEAIEGVYKTKMSAVEFEREDDGRWIAEIPTLPGVMAYGATKQDALRNVYAIALRTLAEEVEQGASLTPFSHFFGYEMAHR